MLLERGPTEDARLAVLRGQLAASAMESSTAVREFRIALKQDPTNREAIQGLSVALAQMGNQDDAVSYRRQGELWRSLTGLLEKARDSGNRRDRAVLRQLGETCAALERYREARAWYRLVLALDPLDASVQQSLFCLGDRVPRKSSGAP
jgi:Flp pilus assembly protein TadD